MNIGDKLPDLLGYDADGKEVRLSNWPGKRFVVFFYPKDNTPGCTAEACSLRDARGDLDQMGYQLIGVSGGTESTHRKFAATWSLPMPLVLDKDHSLAELCGVWQLKKMAGREYMGIVRTTFIVDCDGTITDVIRKVDTKNAAEQVFALLDGRNSLNPA